MGVTAFTLLFNHHHYPSLKFILSPQIGTMNPLSNNLPYAPPTPQHPIQATTIILHVSVNFIILGASYK